MRQSLRLALVAFVALAVPVASRAGRTSEELAVVRADVADLASRISALEGGQDALLRQLAELREAMGLTSPGRRTPADLAARMDSIDGDLRVLVENQNESLQRLSVLNDKVNGLYRRPPPTAQPVPGEGLPVAVPTTTEAGIPGPDVAVAVPAVPEAEPAPPPVDPEELYQAARADYGRGDYPLAMAGFREFLEQFPDSELSDNAQYWIGECLSTQGLREQALVAFEAVAAQHPSGDKVPDALYKRAACLLEVDRVADAIIQLQAVRDGYPTTDAARLARQKLEALGLM